MSTPQERQTNRLLGYPDDARLLIINCDDFGVSHSSNAATERALTEGVAASTTLMAPCPWAPHAIQFLQAHPEIACGVHLTLVCDPAIYRWGPLTPWSRVPSLVDETGRFLPFDRIPELLARAEIAEAELEFRAQIEFVLGANLNPTHLDWHCLADGGRADIFELSFALAREYGLAMRVHGRANAERSRLAGLPVTDYDVLDSYRLATEGKSTHYAQLLRELPAGLSEWAVHPGLGNDEARALEPETWQIRRADLDFLVSPQSREIIDAEGVVLLDYRALQSVWSQSVHRS
jgi:hypothetical protein